MLSWEVQYRDRHLGVALPPWTTPQMAWIEVHVGETRCRPYLFDMACAVADETSVDLNITWAGQMWSRTVISRRRDRTDSRRMVVEGADQIWGEAEPGNSADFGAMRHGSNWRRRDQGLFLAVAGCPARGSAAPLAVYNDPGLAQEEAEGVALGAAAILGRAGSRSRPLRHWGSSWSAAFFRDSEV